MACSRYAGAACVVFVVVDVIVWPCGRPRAPGLGARELFRSATEQLKVRTLATDCFDVESSICFAFEQAKGLVGIPRLCRVHFHTFQGIFSVANSQIFQAQKNAEEEGPKA